MSTGEWESPASSTTVGVRATTSGRIPYHARTFDDPGGVCGTVPGSSDFMDSYQWVCPRERSGTWAGPPDPTASSAAGGSRRPTRRGRESLRNALPHLRTVTIRGETDV